MDITGSTRILFVLADPVGQVRGTIRMNALFAERNIDAVIVPLHVPPTELERAILLIRRTPNIAGFTSTIPHKQTTLPLMDSVSERAALCGAVNWSRRNPDGTLTGENLDGIGFTAGLRAAGARLAGSRVAMFGAGGVARAIAASLLNEGIAHLDVLNRTHARARDLASTFDGVTDSTGRVTAVTEPDGSYEIVINATTLGTAETDPDPTQMIEFTDRMIAGDVVNVPRVTPFLSRAAAAGAMTMPGHAMLSPQLDEMIEFLQLVPRHRTNATYPDR